MGKLFDIEKELPWSHPLRRIWSFMEQNEKGKEYLFLKRLGPTWSRDFKKNCIKTANLVSVDMMKSLVKVLEVPEHLLLWFYQGEGPPPPKTLRTDGGTPAKVGEDAAGKKRRA